MSAVADLTRALIDRGMDPADAAALVGRAGAEMCAAVPSKAALRTRKWREKQASQTVTERHAVTPEDATPETSPTVTERHKSSPRDGASLSLTSTSKEGLPKKKEGKREGLRAERLSPDWQPSEHDIDAAIKRGITRERIPRVAEKFVNHWVTKPSKNTSTNWHRNWCTWCINENEWHGNGSNQQGGGPGSGKGRNFSAIALERARSAGLHD